MATIKELSARISELEERAAALEVGRVKHFHTMYGHELLLEALFKVLPRFLRIEKELTNHFEDIDISDFSHSVQQDVERFLLLCHKAAKRYAR